MKYIFEYGLWENDFFLNEILPKGEVEYVKTELIENVQNYCDVFLFCCRLHDFLDIEKTIKRIRPKIIIMISDEFHQENRYEYNYLANYCDLFLRQYHHPQYSYTSNTIHVPLGYTNGCKIFLEEKKLNWSFVGEIKSDREEMIKCFRTIPKHFVGDKCSKDIMCKIYSKSVFVPCGRGNSSLDCFRLYEASMNGAIPVVVGSKQEIKNTFKYEENPPWVFAETWEESKIKCEELLKSGVDSKNILQWWDNRILKIKTKVLEVL